MTNTVYFSIILIAFNVEKYIKRAIKSIINQNFQNFELIIVNDCSTDNTTNIINVLSEHNSKIKNINHTKNESAHMSRLNGVTASSGRYVLFLDGDDYFNKNALSILYNTIQEYPEYDFYEFGYIHQPSGTEIFPSFLDNDRFISFFYKENSPMPTMWNKVYNSLLLKKAFSSMEHVYINHIEDTYESIIIAYYTKKIMIIEKILINYQTGTGISTTYKDYNKTIEFLNYIKKMIECVELFINNNNIIICFNNLKYRFLKITTFYYINSQKNIDDKKKLLLCLPSYFNNNLILEYLLYDYIPEIDEFYENKLFNITNSKDFKLGYIFLFPLRIIKKLFKIIKNTFYILF